MHTEVKAHPHDSPRIWAERLVPQLRIHFEASRLKYKRNITVTSTAIFKFEFIIYFNSIK